MQSGSRLTALLAPSTVLRQPHELHRKSAHKSYIRSIIDSSKSMTTPSGHFCTRASIGQMDLQVVAAQVF